MKIAVTADVHLTSAAEHPERYHALENILAQMKEEGVDRLIVAGDLFDRSLRNYAEFEALCRRPEYRGVRFLLLPGNHDPGLRREAFAADNVEVFSSGPRVAAWVPEGPAFAFVPYEAGASMGEKLGVLARELEPDNWVLVGHGDYGAGRRPPNPYEPGVYMPLTRADIEQFRPADVFLGHIHQPPASDVVRYPGSPCGLNINETGRRRFLLYDTQTRRVETRSVETDVIWFNESFVLIPVADEADRLEREIKRRVRGWGLSPADAAKVRVRVRAGGYALDKAAACAALRRGFEGYAFHDEAGPDASELNAAGDDQRRVLAEKTRAAIDELPWADGGDEPDRDRILSSALALIYGE